MDNNLASFCYDFIKQNENIVSDLKQYDIEVSPNFDDIKNFISQRTCCNKYYNFIQEMITSIQYVSCDDIIEILKNNINEIVELVKQGYIPVLITTDDSISKSNGFFSLYTLYKLKQKGVELKHIYKTLATVIKKSGDGFIMKESLKIDASKKVLIIFCDDISYSGNQLARHVNDLSLHVNDFPAGVFPGYDMQQNYHKIKFNNEIKIFLNLCGLLPAARRLIGSQFKEDSQLIIPPEVKIFKGILNLNNLIDDKASKTNQSKENFIKLNDCYILNRGESNLVLESQFNKHLQINNGDINVLSFVYPFHKYPDAQSTYTKLCFIKRFDNLLSLNVEEFRKTYNIIDESNFCSFVQSSAIDLGNLLKDAKVDDAVSANLIKKIRDNYDEPQNISDIKWIEVCKPVKLGNNFDNEYGKWFKTLQNLFKTKETTEKFKGSCDKIIPSFYKNLIFNYKGQQINTENTTLSLEDIKNKTEVSAKLKYIKYKTKYIQLKNMCKNLNS